MKIIVFGCGKVGEKVLSALVAEGHDLVAVDRDPSVIDAIVNTYDAMGVCGNGVDCATLREAGAASADLVFAATGSDELNMLCCFLARELGVRHTIARISNPEYNDESLGFLQKRLSLSLAVNPERSAAREIFNVLKLPTAEKIETFCGRKVEMVELRLKPGSAPIGMSLIELRKKYRVPFLICAVQRGDEVKIPDGNFVPQVGDRIVLTAAPEEIQRLLKMMGLLQKQARSVIILGASTTAHYLTKALLAGGTSVKVIDLDREKCLKFSETLPGVKTVCGDGARQELLLEEGLAGTDAFVSLTGMDEENILVSHFAQTRSVPKVITKINRSEFTSTAQQLGLDCFVSPKKAVSDVVVRYARALQNAEGSKMETLYRLLDGNAEALEFSVLSDFALIGTPLKEMRLKEGILIAAIQRGRETMIPSGDDSIREGDRVIVVTSGYRIDDLADIIR